MKWSGTTTCLLLAGCTVGPNVSKGLLTVQGRGSEALTNDGDPLVNTGPDARKVPIKFAKGYTKGVADQVKRTYWARQDAQKTADQELDGRLHHYNATILERQDSNGVIRVQQEVIIPIVE
jgi:hypothetical protein